ncbi:MAG: hypothetical protein U0167_19910 [bacterium]
MTQPIDVFRTITADEMHALLADMRDNLRPLYKQVESVTAATLRVRPVFLGKQPFDKRCDMIKKALSLKMNADAVAEILPAFFLERYPKDVAQLLDALELPHEDGVLKGDAPKEPTKAKLKKVVEAFRKGENPVMRELLLKTFAAQGAIDWPTLDEMVFGRQEAPTRS